MKDKINKIYILIKTQNWYTTNSISIFVVGDQELRKTAQILSKG